MPVVYKFMKLFTLGVFLGGSVFAQFTSLPNSAVLINGGTVPVSAQVLGSNASGQLINNTTPNIGVATATSLTITGLTIGVTCSGDITTALQAAINTLAAANGGIVQLSGGSCTDTAQITFPNDSGMLPKQAGIRITGASAYMDGAISANGAYLGTILTLTYSGATGKIVTLGRGVLEIDHISLIETGASTTTPFLFDTNTTLRIHDTSFIGYTGKTGVTCDQDAIVLGAATLATNGTTTSGFQGYGTVIENNYFNYTRRAIFGRGDANGVQIVNNTVWYNAGSNLAAGAAIEFDGTPGANGGNIFIGNLIETPQYPCGFSLTASSSNTFSGNSFYDTAVPATQFAYCYGSGTVQYNTINMAYYDNTPLNASWPTSTYNFFIDPKAGNIKSQVNGLVLNNYLEVHSTANVYQAAAYNNGSSPALAIRNPSTTSKELFMGYDITANAGFVQAYDNGNSTEPLWLNPNGGKVGINDIVAPGAALQIYGNSAPTGLLLGTATATNAGIGLQLWNDGTVSHWTSINGGSAYMGTTIDTDTMIWKVGSGSTTEAMRLLTGGCLTIGATTCGTSGVFSTTGRIYHASLTTSAGVQTGVVCIGASSEVIQDSVACLASSGRFKHDVQPFVGGLAEVMALRPVQFTYNSTGNANFDLGRDKPRLGFIAEQAATVEPRLIGYDNEGLVRSFAYDNYTAVLTSAIQEQQSQIDSLKARVDQGLLK